MATEISDLWNGLTLEAEDTTAIIPSSEWNGATRDEGFYLVATVLTTRRVPFEKKAFKRIMVSALDPVKEFTVMVLGGSRHLFKFQFEADRDRILKLNPWFFGKQLIVMAEVPADGNPNSIPLNHCAFYIQLHNVVRHSEDKETAKVLGNIMGRFVILISWQ